MEGFVNSSFEQDDDDEDSGGGYEEEEEDGSKPKFNAAKLAKMLRSFADVAESMQGWAKSLGWIDRRCKSFAIYMVVLQGYNWHLTFFTCESNVQQSEMF